MIEHIGRFKDTKTEGSMKISRELIHLSKNVTVSKKIIHLHSAGFGLAAKYIFNRKPKVYTLYSNMSVPFIQRVKGFHEQKKYFHFSSNKRIARIILFTAIARLIPFWVKRFFLSKMTLLVVPTHWLAERLKLKNTKVIPFGIDTELFTPSEKNRKNARVIISYVGSVGNEKGIIDLVKAHRILEKEKLNYQLHLYISGNKNFVKDKEFMEGIHIHGVQENIIEVYQRSDVVVSPHRTTTGAIGIPLVLLEAMACECCVITTDFAHIQEVCSGCVLYSKPHNAQSLAEQIRVAVTDKQLRLKMGENGRKRVCSEYSLKSMRNAYKELYTSIDHGTFN